MSEQATRTPAGEQDFAGTPRLDALLPVLDEVQLEALPGVVVTSVPFHLARG